MCPELTLGTAGTAEQQPCPRTTVCSAVSRHVGASRPGTGLDGSHTGLLPASEGRLRLARDHAAGTPRLASVHHPTRAPCTELVPAIFGAGPWGARPLQKLQLELGSQVLCPQVSAGPGPGVASRVGLHPLQASWSGGSVPSHQAGQVSGSSPPPLRGSYVAFAETVSGASFAPASPAPVTPEPPVPGKARRSPWAATCTAGEWGGLPQKGAACFALGSLWAPGHFGAQRAAARAQRASPCRAAGAEWVAGAQASPSVTCCPPAVASALCLGAGSAAASVPPSLGSW